MPLAAFNHSSQLSVEAAEQLVRMAADPNCPRHKGKDLEPISEAELLTAHKSRRWNKRLRKLREAMCKDVKILHQIIHGKPAMPKQVASKGVLRRLFGWLIGH